MSDLDFKNVPKLTEEQAAIIGAFTGVTAGPFHDMHIYAEELFGNPMSEIELAFRAKELQELAKLDFLAICAEGANFK